MKANDRGKRPDNLTMVVIALAAACVVLLVVVIVLGVTYLSSRDSDTATPTMASLATLTPAQAPSETAEPAETPSATLVPSVTAETETLTPTATPTEMPTETPTASDTPTPTTTPTLEPTPDCAFEPEGEFAALWEDYKVQLGCPLSPTPQAIQDAEQPFENGHMFWRADLRHIYVVYEQGPLQGTRQVYLDEWEEGDPDYSCAAPPPPPEREQPKRGFGLVWCNLGGAEAEIGWALEEELGFFEGQGDPLAQDFDFGVVFRDSLGTVNGKAYVFFSETGAFVHVSY